MPAATVFTDNSLTGRASARDGAVRTGSLSARAATPVVGGMTPERRLQMLGRQALGRGDRDMVTKLALNEQGQQQRGIDRAFSAEQAGEQRNFARERDAVNFDQSMQMRGLDQAFAEKRDATNFNQSLTLEGLRTSEQAMRDERERAQRAQEQQNNSIDAPFTLTDPSGQFMIPGVKTKGGEFKPMGGAYPLPKPGFTPEQIRGMQTDAEKRGYDLVQLPSGEWRLEKKAAPAVPGYETTTTDAEGNTTRSVRKPIGGAGSAGSRTSGLSIF